MIFFWICRKYHYAIWSSFCCTCCQFVLSASTQSCWSDQSCLRFFSSLKEEPLKEETPGPSNVGHQQVAASVRSSSSSSQPQPVSARRAFLASLSEPAPLAVEVAGDHDEPPSSTKTNLTLEGILEFQRSVQFLVEGDTLVKTHQSGRILSLHAVLICFFYVSFGVWVSLR